MTQQAHESTNFLSPYLLLFSFTRTYRFIRFIIHQYLLGMEFWDKIFKENCRTFLTIPGKIPKIAKNFHNIGMSKGQTKIKNYFRIYIKNARMHIFTLSIFLQLSNENQTDQKLKQSAVFQKFIRSFNSNQTDCVVFDLFWSKHITNSQQIKRKSLAIF